MNGRVFRRARRILFADCDPAGIVFYPRYFEIINETVEAWFAEALDQNWRRLILEEGRGVPLAHIEVDFQAPSRLYDDLDVSLAVTRIGGASVGLRLEAVGEGATRFVADLVLVHIDKVRHKPTPWPNDTRARMGPYLTELDAKAP